MNMHLIPSHFSWPLFFSQAEKDLQPWIARDDEQGQKMWRVNQRIVKLIAELMRNHDRPEALVILASASDLLLRATDGMLVDGEACTLPQLEVTFLSFIRFRNRRIPLTKSSVLFHYVLLSLDTIYLSFPCTTNSHDIYACWLWFVCWIHAASWSNRSSSPSYYWMGRFRFISCWWPF